MKELASANKFRNEIMFAVNLQPHQHPSQPQPQLVFDVAFSLEIRHVVFRSFIQD